MAELFLYGYPEPVGTVFELLGRDENDMSAALAWAMARSDRLLAAVLGHVGAPALAHDAAITFQHADEFGITDIQVTVPGRLDVVFEAKRGWTLPTEAQLRRYAQRLQRGEAIDRRLAVLTQWGATNYASKRIAGWDLGLPCEVIGWEDVLKLATRAAKEAPRPERKLLGEFATYLAGVVEMRNIDSNRVYVVSLSREQHPYLPMDFISVVEDHHRYTYGAIGGGWPKVPPNYMGFRYGGRLRSICHVDNYTVATDLSPFFPGGPVIEHEPNFVLSLGPPIIPARPVPNGPGVPRNVRVWADIDLLLTADTITDAVRLTKERRAPSGLPTNPAV